ncbi:MAG TPA: cation:proton antiporter [Candidatus Nanoarchaeia archaeon]|nr:cation:proton antiporter [Candidatus Nanoarchaeia archaeon]
MATELISLGILFLCAIIGGIIANRFKQPAVFGLLLVGAIAGPSALNLVEDQSMVSMMAEFGAILLLFVIGLEFDASKLINLGARPLLIGFMKFAFVLFFGYQATLLLGLGPKVGLFIGAILSFSSTVVVVKVLEQKHMYSRREVPLLISVLIIEDIIAVFILTFFSGIKDTSVSLLSTFENIIFSIAVLVISYIIIMKLLRYLIPLILKNNKDESTFAFLSLAIGASFSYFAASLGISPSAGAFLAGSLIASLPNSKEYGKAVHPYSLIFTSIFFISMGTMVDLKAVHVNLPLIIVLLVTVLISRFIAIGFLTYLVANFKNDQPFFSSIAMISVGEFSLLVAKESHKFVPETDLVSITASIIFLSAIIMSFGINYSENVRSKVVQRTPKLTILKLESIASYLRRFFDYLEIENFFTKKLRHESRVAFLYLSCFTLLLFALRRGTSFIVGLVPSYVDYAVYFIYGCIVLYMIYVLYTKFLAVHSTLSVILTHVDSSRNLRKCTKILNCMLKALVMFFAGMLFPFAIFAFNLGFWANFIPFAILFLSFYYLKKVMNLIDAGSNSVSISHKPSLVFSKFL